MISSDRGSWWGWYVAAATATKAHSISKRIVCKDKEEFLYIREPGLLPHQINNFTLILISGLPGLVVVGYRETGKKYRE